MLSRLPSGVDKAFPLNLNNIIIKTSSLNDPSQIQTPFSDPPLAKCFQCSEIAR